MRIAIISPPWVAVPPPAYGGTEAVLDVLARGLVDAGHEVLLFATGDSTCAVERAWVIDEAAGLGAADTACEIRHVLAARGHPGVREADVIHDHTLVGPLLAAQSSDLPVVTTNHGPFDETTRSYFEGLGESVPVIAISNHQAATAPVPVAAVIHHGVDTDLYQPGVGSGGCAAFIGRMSADKGVAEACRIAHTAGIPLKIAAKMQEPDEHEYFDTAVRPLLHGGVEYIGEVTVPEKIELLGDAYCLLNPIQWSEPFGMVMVEALACGTPVVATAWGSAPELIDDGVTGFVCDDVDQLVAKLDEVGRLDRRACRHAAETRFSVTRMAEAHVEVFEAVASGGRLPERVA